MNQQAARKNPKCTNCTKEMVRVRCTDLAGNVFSDFYRCVCGVRREIKHG